MTEPDKTLSLAIVQMGMEADRGANIERACRLVTQAAALGADVILLPELFETPYFPREVDDRFFALATTLGDNPAVAALAPLARQHAVVIPVSFFERDGDHYYNSLTVLDADGRALGLYRKSHIPDGAGYEEKHYFRPGDTGFTVFDTAHGRLGIGICWDQWFPECARALTLAGAEVLLYPTAIGSEPLQPHRDTAAAWQRVMIGHAVANTIPVAAANRVGNEGGQVFYGSSFACDGFGERMTELNRIETGIGMTHFDRDLLQHDRDWMGLLRDRRPDLYAPLTRK